MSFYRKAKPCFDAFRGIASKPPVLKSTPPSPPPRSPPSSSTLLIQEFKRGLSISSSIHGGRPRRSYYVDQQPRVVHFKRRGRHRWSQNPRAVFAVVVLGAGVAITVYFGNLETVPYTKRTHFVLLSMSMERQLGESQFEQIKVGFRGKILPPYHPESVRVRLIAKDIIGALQRGLRKERVWSDLEYAAPESLRSASGSRDGLVALMGAKDHWYGEKDELLDDKWVQSSRKTGQARGRESETTHLEGLNWEVLVVREPIVNAFCLPGGKTVVFTGLLDHFTSDAEIATVIGHEVGHAVARHIAEGLTKNLWFAMLQLIVLQFVGAPELIDALSNLLLRLPFSRSIIWTNFSNESIQKIQQLYENGKPKQNSEPKEERMVETSLMETEADYIGLLLVASAGYNPRVAPTVYEKLGKLSGDSALKNYLSTHPSGKKRAQLLSQAHVMEEALSIYRESMVGHGVEGFL
ncbi:hypothetical protein QJS10_CPA10g00747 [Acorus calamus]|uniref:Peptidase M48 domain-containing protein n=1 Tax=Acorus calamus TaxID=4465 RepID=A0AAV9E1A2_ACOCL|nr:hypothetical protein QJS10_CPA10g00747 [Acorus calamus]